MTLRVRHATPLWLAIALTCLPALPIQGHERSVSYSTWQLDDRGGEVQLRIKLLELTRLAPDHDWTETFAQSLRLRVDGETCVAHDAERLSRAPVGWAQFRWRVACESGEQRSLRSELMDGLAVAHTHFARVSFEDPDGAARRETDERVLITGRDPVWVLDGKAGREAEGTDLLGYVSLGLEHILEGWDHLAFVLALLLLAGTLRELVTLVTSFTLAHSLTLGLAVTGAVRPDATAVEILIGFSIALVAAENGWLLAGRDAWIRRIFTLALLGAAVLALTGSGALSATAWLGLALFSWCHFRLLDEVERAARLRAVVAFAFGLVHGLGFAGVLMEIELPAGRLLGALLGFNVGVELGQLAVVALVWPLLMGLTRIRDGALHVRVAELGSAVVLGLGLYWAVLRNWGG